MWHLFEGAFMNWLEMVLAGAFAYCAAMALINDHRRKQHLAPSTSWLQANSHPGSEDPALYTKRGNQYRLAALRYTVCCAAIGLIAAIVGFVRR